MDVHSSGKVAPRVGDEFGHVLAVHAEQEHGHADDDEHVADHAPGQLNADQHADHGDPLVQVGLGPGPVVDGLEIHDPVTYRHHRPQHEQVVQDSEDQVLGLVDEEDQDIGDDDVNPAVVLGRRRFENGGPGIEQDHAHRKKIKEKLLDFIKFLVHCALASALR